MVELQEGDVVDIIVNNEDLGTSLKVLTPLQRCKAKQHACGDASLWPEAGKDRQQMGSSADTVQHN